MITRLTYTSIYVLDQDSAYNFYVNKLGFTVHRDVILDFSQSNERAYNTPQFRWLTLSPPDQPDLQVILNPIVEGVGFTHETAVQMRALVKAGTFGFGIWGCKNLNITYEELTAKGVTFTKPPTQEPYGFEALFEDDSGNWFSLMEINTNEVPNNE